MKGKSPILVFTILLIFGIISGYFLQLSNFYEILGFTFVSIILVLIFLFFKQKILANIFSYISIFSVGIVLITHFSLTTEKYPFEQTILRNVQVFGKVTELSLPNKKGSEFILQLDSIKSENSKIQVKINLLCKTKNTSQKVRYGDYLQIQGSIIRARNKRNPEEFDYSKYLWQNDLQGILSVKSINQIHKKTEKSIISEIQNYVFDIRLNLVNIIKKYYTGEKSNLIRALLIGDRKDIDHEIVNSFVIVGVVHVLAVSGLHVGFIVMILNLLLGRTSIYWRIVLSIIGIFLFAIISGGQPSVLRASIMAILMLISTLYGRKYNSISVLAVAALLILIFNPIDLFNPGFQLSFSAVFSIVYFHPKIQKYIIQNVKNHKLQTLLTFFLLTFSATIGTLPFTIYYFHIFSIASFFANLLVVPLIGFVVSLAVASLTVSFLPFVAFQIATTNSFLIDVIFKIVDLSAKWEFSFIEIFQFNLAISILYFVILVIIIYSFSKSKKLLFRVFIIFLSSFMMYVYSNILKNNTLPQNKMNIVMIDIGQGDSFLLQFPDNTIALIDAGNSFGGFDNGKSVILPLMKNLGINKIDYLFITHLDADHYLGSFSIIEKGIVKRAFKPIMNPNSKKDVEYEKFLKKNNVEIFHYHRQKFNFGSVRIFVLNDSTAGNYKEFDQNNKSGILKLVYGETEVLFTGDLEIKGEYLWIEFYDKFLQSDILKAGHHGSKGSTSQEFLDLVKPNLALISAGENNSFKHPNKETIEKLEKEKIEILRTDKSGAIILSLDGKSVKKINWK